MDIRLKMQEMISRLNEASEAYYGGRDEIMSNYEWDALFDELLRLEEESGIVLPGSPTHSVSSSVEDNLSEKEPHEYPALSLAKTKSIEDLQNWAGDMPIYLSWKLDGLTLVATYDGGKLTRLLTRGDGAVGTNISYMSAAIRGLPRKLSYTGHLVVRGEATISYTDFEAINASLEEGEERYANPRNLASGTLALDAKHLDKVHERRLSFNAFTLVYIDDEIISWGERMDLLRALGFTTVEYEACSSATLPEVVARWTRDLENGKMDIPVDGLVICYDDTIYAASGSVTGRHAARAGLAFKWEDASAVTTLRRIEWSCSAYAITPIAIFDPVRLEGTTVTRASLVNISELRRLGIGAVDLTTIRVIKANKIIPKCVEVISARGECHIPDTCPVCSAPTSVFESASGTLTLRCSNPDCPAKSLRRFVRFVGRDGMDIDGLSIETLRDFINERFISSYPDIFRLSRYADRIRTMEGYGEKSCSNLMGAIERSRKVHPAKLLNALGIPLIGTDAAKRIVSALGWEGFLRRLEAGEGFEDIAGIGAERSGSISAWYALDKNRSAFHELISLLDIEPVMASVAGEGSCAGLTFVISGDVHIFKNRDEFKAYVESQGGKLVGSVSKKTDFLVNNEPESLSSKNKKARDLGVPVISEKEFVSRFMVP